MSSRCARSSARSSANSASCAAHRFSKAFVFVSRDSKRRATDSKSARKRLASACAVAAAASARALRSSVAFRAFQRISLPLGASRAGRRGDELLLGGGGASVRRARTPPWLARTRASPPPRLLHCFCLFRRARRIEASTPPPPPGSPASSPLRVPFARRPALGEVFARPLPPTRLASRRHGVGDGTRRLAGRRDPPRAQRACVRARRAQPRRARHSAWLNASGSSRLGRKNQSLVRVG